MATPDSPVLRAPETNASRIERADRQQRLRESWPLLLVVGVFASCFVLRFANECMTTTETLAGTVTLSSSIAISVRLDTGETVTATVRHGLPPQVGERVTIGQTQSRLSPVRGYWYAPFLARP